jgi:hypothetical protein
MIHPSTEVRFISDEIGYGVVATALIPKGTITWALDDLDQVMAVDRVAQMSEFIQRYVHKYAYMDGAGRHILCWDNARFVNHHCEATCLGAGFEFEVAIRDIQPGEQLTDDYGGLNIEEEFNCRCGSPKCRGVVHPNDILALADTWDAHLVECFAILSKVPQPLWPIVRHQARIQAVLDGREQMISSRAHYHPYDGIRPAAAK